MGGKNELLGLGVAYILRLFLLGLLFSWAEVGPRSDCTLG
jgi:hypothetical protein